MTVANSCLQQGYALDLQPLPLGGGSSSSTIYPPPIGSRAGLRAPEKCIILGRATFCPSFHFSSPKAS